MNFNRMPKTSSFVKPMIYSLIDIAISNFNCFIVLHWPEIMIQGVVEVPGRNDRGNRSVFQNRVYQGTCKVRLFCFDVPCGTKPVFPGFQLNMFLFSKCMSVTGFSHSMDAFIKRISCSRACHKSPFCPSGRIQIGNSRSSPYFCLLFACSKYIKASMRNSRPKSDYAEKVESRFKNDLFTTYIGILKTDR